MSFLTSDNESATLAAALAFIDAAFDATDADVPELATADSSSSSCDGTGVEHASITASSSCDSPSSSSSNSSRYNSDKLQDGTSSRGGDRSKQPKRSNAPAAMRLRRKRKAERIQLREQVAALEEQLKMLQQRQAHGVDRTSDTTTSSSLVTAEMLSKRLGKSSQAAWPAVASRIQQERHRAELLNIQLKEILSKQVKLAKSLKGAFQKRGVFQGIDIVFQPPAPSRGLSFSPSVDHNAVLSKMEMVVRDMYSATDSVLDSSLLSSIAESVFSSSAVKHDEGNGAYVEVATATPMACTYDQALQIIQGGLKLKDTLTNKQLIHNREENDRFAEKTYMVMLQDDHSAVSLRGAYLMRKFEAKHHTAYICASTARPPSTTGVEFCERGWMVLSPSPLDPSCRTILRTCYQVSVDTGDIRSLAAKIDDVGYLERFVLHSLSKKMRTMLQTMQNSLLDEVERVGGIPSTIAAF